MRSLSKCDFDLARWFEFGRPPGKAISVPSTSPERILAIVKSGKIKLEGAGYTCGLWNGKTGGAAANLFLNCGASIFASQVRYPNFLLLLLGDDFLAGPRSSERILCMFRSVIQVLSPRWASFDSQGLRDAFDTRAIKAPTAGWITFVPYGMGQLAGLKEVGQIVDVPGHGTLLAVRDALDPSRRSIEQVLELHGDLVSAGLEELTDQDDVARG